MDAKPIKSTFACPLCGIERELTAKRLARSLREGQRGICRSCAAKNGWRSKIKPVVVKATTESKNTPYKPKPSWLTRWIYGER